MEIIDPYRIRIDNNIGINTNIIRTRIKNDLTFIYDGLFRKSDNSPMIQSPPGCRIFYMIIFKIK